MQSNRQLLNLSTIVIAVIHGLLCTHSRIKFMLMPGRRPELIFMIHIEIIILKSTKPLFNGYKSWNTNQRNKLIIFCSTFNNYSFLCVFLIILICKASYNYLLNDHMNWYFTYLIRSYYVMYVIQLSHRNIYILQLLYQELYCLISKFMV